MPRLPDPAASAPHSGPASPDEEDPFTPEESEAIKEWWAHLPDFIKPSYPFDLPPDRLRFAQAVFTEVGASKYCPVPECRRARACLGGDGPPCFRADRRLLHVALFWFWSMVFDGVSPETYRDVLVESGNRYAPGAADPNTSPRRPRKRRAPAPSERIRPQAEKGGRSPPQMNVT